MRQKTQGEWQAAADLLRHGASTGLLFGLFNYWEIK